MAASELPEHAKQSVSGASIIAGTDVVLECNQGGQFTSTAIITPAQSGVPLRYDITTSAGATLLTATPGTLSTGPSGDVSLIVNAYGDGFVTVTWSFVNPADGSGSDSQPASNTGC